MAASREDVSRWFDEGVKQGQRWMVVLCDTFDWEDYPSYFRTEDAARKTIKDPGSMQQVMECYDLRTDKYEQMKQRRAMALTV